MDKITYLRKIKEKIENDYLEKLDKLDKSFKSDNVIITVYIEKIIFEYLDYKVNNGDLELDNYDLKELLRGKLRFPINSRYADGKYVTQWFVDRCPKCGCYLYYPKYNPNSGYTGVCVNCFEERTLERLKAINFPTEKSGQLVNYKYYTVAGTMNRNELEQFMRELGNKKYCNGTLMSIDKDLNMLELCDTIDSGNAIGSRSIDSDNKEKDTSEKDISARDDIEKTMKSFFGNIWDNLYQDE